MTVEVGSAGPMPEIGRALVLLGVVIAIVGVVLMVVGRVPGSAACPATSTCSAATGRSTSRSGPHSFSASF